MNIMQECLTPWSIASHFISESPSCTEIYQSAIPTDGSTFKEYTKVFLMTYMLELPVYFYFLRIELSWPAVLLTNFVVNIATHPIIYLVMPGYFSRWGLNYIQYVIIAEIFAPAVEAALLRYVFRLNWQTATAAAICANLFSWTIGVYWNS